MTTTLRGLTTRHSPPLIETRFLEDVGYGEPRPTVWPWWIRLPFIAIASGICWGAVIVLILAINQVIRG